MVGTPAFEVCAEKSKQGRKLMSNLNTFRSNATAPEIARSIDKKGYAIIHDVLDAGEIEQLQSELQPHLDATSTGVEDFLGHKTKRFGALLARSPKSHDMATHPLLLGIADEVLGSYCANVQLNYTGVMYLEPGEITQVLHRDGSFYPIQNPRPPMLLATIWAVTDFTRENGATRLVPGSHRWEDARQPLSEEAVAAEMPAGSVLLYLDSTLHGAGANQSNGPRCGAALHYALAWLRQEENQYLAMPLEQARTLPKRLQKLMGYDLATVNLGFVDHRHPNDLLNDVPVEKGQPLGAQDLMDADNAIQRFKVNGTSAVGRRRYQLATDTAD